MDLSLNDLWWIIPLLVWELIWKGLALWRAARLKQPVWFVVLLILNTAGILPIIYLLTHREKQD
jgi:hypothetical protein